MKSSSSVKTVEQEQARTGLAGPITSSPAVVSQGADRETDGDAAENSSLAQKELLPPRMRGNTYIDDEVVSVISRIAAEQVPGVHKIGESSLRNMFSRLSRHHGVEAEAGLHEAAADIEMTVEFGYSMRDVAQDVRERVINAIESMTGRRVVEVNIYILDVYIPKSAGPRRRRELE